MVRGERFKDMNVTVVNEGKYKIPNIPWEDIFKETSVVLGVKSLKPISIVFASKSRVRELNNRYRGKDKPTNVLSFEESRDIIVSPEIIEEEAVAQGESFEKWLSTLVVHGILHLEGYTHDTNEDASKMEGIEDRVIKKLDIS